MSINKSIRQRSSFVFNLVFRCVALLHVSFLSFNYCSSLIIMENRLTARPWFRMPLRMETLRPQPQPLAPQPRPPLLLPAFVQAIRPPTPQPQPAQPQAIAPPTPQPQPAQPQAIAPPTATLPTQVNPPSSASLQPSPKAKASPSSSLPTSPAPKALSPPSPLLPTSHGPTTQPVQSQAIALPTAALVAPVSSESSVSLPPSPKPKISTSYYSQPTSSSPKASSPPSLQPTSAAFHAPTPMQSPKIIRHSSQTPPYSPKTKPSAQPPSPLLLPPSQLEPVSEPKLKPIVAAEQKNELVQTERFAELEPKPLVVAEQKSKVVYKERFKTIPAVTSSDLKKDAHNGSNKHSNGEGDVGQNKDRDVCKKSAGAEDVGRRVIIIAGENKGAYMELGYFNKKQDKKGDPYLHHHHIHKNSPKSIRDSKESRSSSDDRTGKNKTMPTSTTPMSAFVNSNVQVANNSILLQCSCAHNDPGVHLNLSRKPASQLKERSNSQQS